MRPTVLLFDIDGTLITTGGAGRRAIVRAFADRYGRGDAFDHFNFGGMTDRAIVREGLRTIGHSFDEAEIDAAIADYVRVLEDEVARATTYRLHDGMLEALDAAKARARCAVGLGTGNIEEGARLKLARVGVWERFGFGGFGSDHEDRPTLIAMGADRGARRLGVPVADCRVVIIGDTPRDVDAAHRNGFECLAVATGGASADELRAAGARRVFRDLKESGAIDALLDD